MLALEAARRDLVLSRIELFRQIGQAPNDRVKLTDSLDSTAPLKAESVAIVLAARADVTAAEADVRLQRAIGVPDLEVLGGSKRNFGVNTAYAGVQIPLAFRNRNRGEVARAEASVRLAKDRLQALELSVNAYVKAAQEAYTQQGRWYATFCRTCEREPSRISPLWTTPTVQEELTCCAIWTRNEPPLMWRSQLCEY